VQMWDRPGGKARRGLKIRPEDWSPFAHLLSVHDDVDSGIFTGFHFLDRDDETDGNGRGPCSFRFFVGSTIRVDACVPLDDWAAGRLDVEAVVAAMQGLPFTSFMAGFGLSLGERYAGSPGVDAALMEYARRYSAVDLLRDEDRGFFPGGLENHADTGINWLTGVGEPFRGRAGGGARLGAGLPAGIAVADGPHGVAFRLGDRPVSGEAGVDDANLPLFHALGAKLAAVNKPLAEGRHAPVFGEGGRPQSLAWERRFGLIT
jgi:hypothetical protein